MPHHPNFDPRLLDFRNFLFVIWKHLTLPDPTPVQYDLAGWIDKGPRRRGAKAFRGVGKSWITVAFACHRFYKNSFDTDIKSDTYGELVPCGYQIEVVSASKNLADNFSTFALQLIRDVPILSHLIPGPDQRDAKVQFDVGGCRPSKDPSLKSVGITGQITGTRADLIIADDVETPNNSTTQEAREKLAELVKEFDAVLKPNGEVVYLGTPQTEESLYSLLATRGYKFRVWPARCPTKKQFISLGDELAPMIGEKIDKGELVEGQPTDPRRFTDIDLAEREASYGRSGFALQFQMDTSLSDAERYPLKLSDLVVMDLDIDVGPEKVVWANTPELVIREIQSVGFSGDRFHRPMSLVGGMVPYAGSVIAVDPAGRGADRLGYAIVKALNGQLFVLACDSLSGGYCPENLEFLAEQCKKFKVNYGYVESNFGDGMFTALWQPVLGRIYPMSIMEERNHKQKELRIIDSLEPVMNQHKLIIDRSVVVSDCKKYASDTAAVRDETKYQLFHQMTRITKERGALAHDDSLDALAMAIRYWTKVLARDADKAVEEKKQSDLERALKNFISHTSGRVSFYGGDLKPQSSSWLND